MLAEMMDVEDNARKNLAIIVNLERVREKMKVVEALL